MLSIDFIIVIFDTVVIFYSLSTHGYFLILETKQLKVLWENKHYMCKIKSHREGTQKKKNGTPGNK